MQKRKLIEVALPLEVINRESTRENYIYRGNPSSVHKWWAQRPLAAARAVLFAQLVDDPSARPEDFPTEELQRKERERLHDLIERLVVWENMGNEKLLAEAHVEILKSTDGNPPPILDPFAGGGTIPLEAQRLGLEARASDVNPVSVLINKALIEIPQKFRDRSPIFPGLAGAEIRTWRGAEGLGADVRAYGLWMRDEAEERIGYLYPKADGKTVIAWIWARTVTCPNPACGIEMPLVRSWWLGKKKGKEAYVVPSVVADDIHPSGRRVEFQVGHEMAHAPRAGADGTIKGASGKCLACATIVRRPYLRQEGCAGRLNAQLMAVVAEEAGKRIYLPPTREHEDAAVQERPNNVPDAALPDEALGFRVQGYGLTNWADLFTNRQLIALTTFSDLVSEARERVVADGGSGDYADAVATYVAFALSKILDYQNSLTAWYPQEDRPSHLFTLQAIPMLWDHVEVAPFARMGGTWPGAVEVVALCVDRLGAGAPPRIEMADASNVDSSGALISTDPPYYDNVGYSDLSDFFYVWLRRSLRTAYPELLSTMLVPKAEELVANPFRHGGSGGAEAFFESGFRKVFANARASASVDCPITVYYAFRQSESRDSGRSSTGWETLLEGMVRSGWMITSTWPLRSERSGRMRDIDSNALASSIVLSLRPRAEEALTTDRRGFIVALEADLPDALRKLQQGMIAPVDLPQAAIGPGMAVFSRYSAVIEADGSQMSVRSALARINEILDQVLNEQEGDFDSTTRFAIAWYRQHGYGVGTFGDADNLARARNTSVETMDRDEILTSRAGKVQLIKPADTPAEYDVLADSHTSTWEVLHHAIRVLEQDGVTPAGDFLALALTRPDGAVETDLIKELAHLLFRIAEQNGWTRDALSFNSLVTSFADVIDVIRDAETGAGKPRSEQSEIDFNIGDE